MPEQLTMDQFLALFGRTAAVTGRTSYADSVEYLALVTYLVDRRSGGAKWSKPKRRLANHRTNSSEVAQ